MTDLVQRLRQIAPYFAPHALVLVEAADALEAKDIEIARLERNEALWRDDYNEIKALCDQMGNALEAMAGYGNLFHQMGNALEAMAGYGNLIRTSGNQRNPYHTAVDALTAWREIK